jgi:hypothetical protein
MRRSTPALFEVLGGATVGRRTGASAPPPPPRPIVVNAPDTRPEAAEAPSPLPREPWADEPASPRGLGLQRRFNISISIMLLAAAGVIGLSVLTWSAAYEAGKSEAKAEAARELRLQSSGSAVRDPLNSDLPLNPGLVKQASVPAPAPGGSTTVPPSPAHGGDPREAGKNYLQLITTDRREAEGIVKFLGENGVAAFMIGVDGGGSTAKNPARFTVLASRGITREELQARVPARTELEQAIDRLGKVWKGERRGSTDFSGKIWSKHKG